MQSTRGWRRYEQMMPHSQIWVLAVLWVWVASSSLHADRVDRYAMSQLKKQNVPGLSLAVVRNGRVIKSGGYGLADVELNVPARPETVYQWASITKQFTAAAVLLLVEEGRLRLEDRISGYLTNVPPAWSNVTVRQLLNHTSGIRSYTSLPRFFDNARKDFLREEIIGLVRDLPLDFEPGERWSYNNTGYYLLGMILEKASGLGYGEYLQQRVLGPVGMKTARLNEQFLIITNRATGYTSVSNRWRTAEFVSPTQPYSAGALVGTVLDLARWDAALYDDRPLSAASRNLMWTPTRLNTGDTREYGFGWGLGAIRGHRFVAHGGGIHGFSTYILRLLEQKLTVIVLMNGPANPEAVARGVADQYVPGLLLSSIKPRPDREPSLTKQLEACLRDLAAGQGSPPVTPEFRSEYAKTPHRAKSLSERLSGMKSFTFITHEPAASDQAALGVPIHRNAHYKMVTGKETWFYTFELTAEGKVASYSSSDQ